MEILKAGKLRTVPCKAMEAIEKICGGNRFWYQPVGRSWEDNGVVILRPTEILESEDGGKEKLQTIAHLLGVSLQEISEYYLLEVWDDR